jgi:ADP-heptose:LPS heptosyltransferase
VWLLAGRWNRNLCSLLKDSGVIDGWIEWDSFACNRTQPIVRRLTGAVRTFWSALAEVRKAKFDIAIDLRPYTPNALLLFRLANIPKRSGFPLRGKAFTLHCAFSYDPRIAIGENFQRALPRLGLIPASYRGSEVWDVLGAARISALRPDVRPFVILHPCGGRKHKDLPAAVIPEMIKGLIDRFDVVVFGGASDRQRMPWLAELGSWTGVHDLVGRTSVIEVAQYSLAAIGAIVVDSFVAHLLVGSGKRVVVYGDDIDRLRSFYRLEDLTIALTESDLLRATTRIFESVEVPGERRVP